MRAILAAMVVMIAGAAMSAEPATQPTTRPSAKARARMTTDGVALPEVARAERVVNIKSPAACSLLDATPEQISDRLFVSDKTPGPLNSRGVTLKPGAFYTIDKYGADIVELVITDGRVSSLVLYFCKVNKDHFYAALRTTFPNGGTLWIDGNPSEIEMADKSAMPQIPIHYKHDSRNMIGQATIAIGKVDWYLASHPEVADNVANAMRKSMPAVGMTREQAEIVFGRPTTITENSSDIVLTWKMSRVNGVPRGPFNERSTGVLAVGGHLYSEWKVVAASLTNGVVNDFSVKTKK